MESFQKETAFALGLGRASLGEGEVSALAGNLWAGLGLNLASHWIPGTRTCAYVFSL